MKHLLVFLALVFGLLGGVAHAQGPAGDPRDNLDHPGTPTDRYLDPGELRDVLHQANDAFYGCYRTHVRGTKEAGEVAVRLSVGRDGKVFDAAAELDGAPPDLGPCLVDVLQGLEFAPHDGDPVVVSYPLVYQVDRRGARVLPYPVVFTKPRAIRLPLMLLPADIGVGELRMLERVFVDPEERAKEGQADKPEAEASPKGETPRDEDTQVGGEPPVQP